MGYTTDFDGAWAVTPPLTEPHRDYLAAFSRTRRMRRDPLIAAAFPDPVRRAAGLPIGDDGGYFVGTAPDNAMDPHDPFGQDHDASILDYNQPPSGQPGLWCQWVPTHHVPSGHIEWDGGEKFYDYTDWIAYLIGHFLEPWGYTLNGEVRWFGEDREDFGVIRIVGNVVTSGTGTIIYPTLGRGEVGTITRTP